jgi:cytochrome c-type biogenesis protein CcmH
MTVFWSLAAIMVMAALLFTLPPMLRNRESSTVTGDALNTEVIKSQLAELEADLEAGKLDRTQYAAARSDLERELLYDLAAPGDTPAHNAPVRSGRWATLLLIPAIPVCAVLLYQQLGSGELIEVLQQAKVAQPKPATPQNPAAHSIDEMVARLAERLRAEPDDMQGWAMLAKSYTIMKRFDAASDAYANVVRLGGETPTLLTDYADAMVMAEGGNFSDEAGALLLRALEQDPDNLKGLWLAGHWKYRNQEFAEALTYWQQVAQQVPADSEDGKVIAQQIGQAQAQLGITATAPPPAAATATTVASTADNATGGATLSVQVALDPALQDAATAEDTVFIFARATQGPRMPLAIVRKQVKDLPVTVNLDDSMAMSPAMVLSKFEQVLVGARVSKSGNAMASSGDLEGSVSPVATGSTQTVEITIDSRVQ